MPHSRKGVVEGWMLNMKSLPNAIYNLIYPPLTYLFNIEF
jgi:hypothetical protein